MSRVVKGQTIILTKPERRVLEHLAMHGPSIGNEMSKSPGLSSKTASIAPRSLKEKGLVTCIYRTSGYPALEYSLTIKGLALVLTLGTEKAHVAFSIKHWKHLLPHILGKWAFFRREGVDRIAERRLVVAAEWFVRPFDKEALLEYGLELPTFALVCKGTEQTVFYELFYSLRHRFGCDSRWIEAGSKDPMIRLFFKGNLVRMKSELEESKKEYRAISEALRRVQRPEPST